MGLFLKLAFRDVGTCWIRFVNVVCVSVSSVSAASADFTVLADTAFSLE